jgi:hypothetical protein
VTAGRGRRYSNHGTRRRRHQQIRAQRADKYLARRDQHDYAEEDQVADDGDGEKQGTR